MTDLYGRRIAVLVESEFIPGEIAAYLSEFAARGARVHLISRLWNQPRQTFFCNAERAGEGPETLDVDIDVDAINLDDYAAVIMAANYCSVRLRMYDAAAEVSPTPAPADMVRTAPAVRLFAAAMARPDIIKGALCHGLWLLTPVPELLAGRHVICHAVVLADVLNAGGVFVPSPDGIAPTPQTPAPGVVVDRDLVTGDSWHRVSSFISAIAEEILVRA